jgi:hypothetical protein
MATLKEQELAKALIAIAASVQPKIKVIGNEIEIDYLGTKIKLLRSSNQVISDRLSSFR